MPGLLVEPQETEPVEKYLAKIGKAMALALGGLLNVSPD